MYPGWPTTRLAPRPEHYRHSRIRECRSWDSNSRHRPVRKGSQERGVDREVRSHHRAAPDRSGSLRHRQCRDWQRTSSRGAHCHGRRAQATCGTGGPATSGFQQMNQFNASAWALEHKSFVGFLMVLLSLAGLLSYGQLGRDEDPPLTIKVMVVRAIWPGATAEDTAREVTDRLEKALQSLQWIDYISSYTKPGEATLMVQLKDQTPPSAVPDQWYQVHKKISDIRHTLPLGTQGPFFNDEFGDVYAVIYAFTSDGFTYRELRDTVESVRSELLRVPNVGKVDLIGVQNEVVYVDFSTRELAGRGIDTEQLAESLRAQNAVNPSGVLETSRDRVTVRVSGQLNTTANIEQLSVNANGRLVPLRDLATVTRSYEDPPSTLFRYNGQPAIGLAVRMAKGGNILQVGNSIAATMRRIEKDLPVGNDPYRVANQPQ